MSKKVQLRTERLLLRRYTEEDIPALLPLLSAREVVVTTLRIPHPYTEKDAREFIQRMQAQEIPSNFGIFDAATGQLYGGVGLTVEEQHSRAELGYWIGFPYWGRGYATEAAREIVRHGFEELKLNRIFAGVFAGNETSVRVLEKLGFKYEGTARKQYLKWGVFLDSLNFALLAEEWKAL